MIGEDILCDLELPGEEEGGIEPAGSMAVPGAVPDAVPGVNAVERWRSSWASPWKRPESKPTPPGSLLRREGYDSGPWRGSCGILAGAGAVGKSFAALELAVKVAAGPGSGAHTWCGFDIIESGRVVYVAAEDPEVVIEGRLFDITEKLKLNDSQLRLLQERLFIVPMADSDPELLRVWRLSRQMEPEEAKAAGVRAEVSTDAGGVVRLKSPNLSEARMMGSELLMAMREDMQGADDIALVVMDPLSRLGGSDAEGDNAVAARLMRALGGLAVAAKAAVLVVHHTTKAARGAKTADGTGIRGSSALVDGSRWAGELTEAPGEGLCLSVSKASYGREPGRVYLRREDWGGLRVETEDEKKKRLKAAEEASAKKATRKNKKRTAEQDVEEDE